MDRRPSVLSTMTETINRRMSFIKLDSTIGKSLEYWSRNNPLLMADEVFLESRGVWTSKADFFVSCIGYGIGLGNIWRFPFFCLKYGCGSFLVAYTFFVVTIAMPLSLLETALAQFTSTGVTQCWRLSPGFKGIGYMMLLVSLFCSFYYTLVLAWSLFYSINSVRIMIPFFSCDNFWNDNTCISLSESVSQKNMSQNESSAAQFWYRYVTTQLSIDGETIHGIDKNPDILIWYTSACLIIAWTITAYILTKGVRVTLERVFISIIFPYIVVLVFIILSALLPGSKIGLKLLFTPKMETLLLPETWLAAGEQIFFSVGVGFGGIVTMASYNRFHYNLQRDTIIICIINFITSILSAIISFQILGYISHRYSKSMDDIISESDLGLIFIIMPECCAYFSMPQLTNTLFFLTLFILGFDSVLIMMETVVTGLIDIAPVLNETQYHRICFVFVLHIGCMLFSLIFVTKTGFNWFVIFTKYGGSVNLLLIGLIETIVVTYVYRLKNFYRDCQMMVPQPLFFIWKISYACIIPVVMLLMVGYGFGSKKQTYIGKVGNKSVFPIWADVIGWIILITSILPIPGFFVCYVIYIKLSKELSLKDAIITSIKPDIKWGPMRKRKWLTHPYYEARLLIIKQMAEKQKNEPKLSLSKGRKQWYKRLNLLSDSGVVAIESDDSNTQSKDTDSVTMTPLEINFDMLGINTE